MDQARREAPSGRSSGGHGCQCPARHWAGCACAGLPLALQITAALLKADASLSTTELAGALAVERDRLERLRYDDGSGAGTPSVAAAFDLSYQRLDPEPARVFRLLPVNPGPDISTEAAAILADLPADVGGRPGRDAPAG